MRNKQQCCSLCQLLNTLFSFEVAAEDCLKTKCYDSNLRSSKERKTDSGSFHVEGQTRRGGGHAERRSE